MKKSPPLKRISIPALLAAFSLLLFAPVALFGQGDLSAKAAADLFAGTYKGVVKVTGGNFDLRIEIKSENGKLYGSVVTPQGEQTFTSSELTDGKLKIKLGPASSPEIIALQLHDDKLVGEWKAGKETRALELERVPAIKSPPAADLLSGVWDAAADAQGQAFPFTLTLKVDGDKVTGSSSSELGNSTISSGTFKDGKLALVLESANGQTALVGTMVDGKLVGDYDYNGQLSGKWVATKKKP
jgi:hypothetical protein